ncbi:formyltetrahydrofolate deformylase [Bradyrhizobium sp. U531]|uniref:formyltetrahydrofolate deformylase n=1 Tax=Bradyrhizobium sp. U531 TaxID=3053458 RepID=UPI003F429C72
MQTSVVEWPREGHSQRPDFVLTFSCPDRIGIVHAVSGLLAINGCNIRDSAQFSDRNAGKFFMRVAFDAQGGRLVDLQSQFSEIGGSFDMSCDLHDCRSKPRILIMVSKAGHCLNDLLFRHASGTLAVDISSIVSNHPDFERLAVSYDIPFHYLPITADKKLAQEAKILELVEQERIDLIVLVRYMQVLSNNLCRNMSGKIINIHHSFLPSFKGARPYHQAHSRGVKLIGATAHYVTADLDEGPIIEQDVLRVDHSLEPDDLTAMGRDVEATSWRAVKLHAEKRILVNGDRTVIFR